MIKVKELIELLERFDGEKPVVIETTAELIEDVCVNEGIEGEVVITPF